MKTLFKTKQFNYSDLEILATLIAKERVEIFVFDPDGKVNWDASNENQGPVSTKKLLFNFGGDLVRYKQFQLSEIDYIVDFGTKIKLEGYACEKLKTLQTTRGVLRYIFQSDDEKLNVLQFFPTPTLRAKCIKWALKVGMRHTRLLGHVASVNIWSKTTLHYHNLLDGETYDHYSIFTGTPGFWRKPVIQLIQNGEIKRYVKCAVSPQTNRLISREKININRVKALQLTRMEIPKIVANKNRTVLVQEALETENGVQKNRLTDSHFTALEELMFKTLKYNRLSATDWYTDLLNQMNVLKNMAPGRFARLGNVLSGVMANIAKNDYVMTTVAHGDFTPWNCTLNADRLMVYDWEMALFETPAFYDAYHYIYQTEILVNRTGLAGVEHELQVFFNQPAVKDFVQRYGINPQVNHQLYLIHVASKNIVLMSQQATISPDQKLMLSIWQKALSKLPVKEKCENARALFLEEFQTFLQGKEYAALKFFLPNFKALPEQSDLDLAVDKKQLGKIEKFIARHRFVQHHQTVRKSFMHTTRIYFTNGAFLSVDLIYDFIRKGVRYMNIESVLNNARMTNGVMKPLLFHDIEYAQHFYTLNKSGLPLKYQQIFTKSLYADNIHTIYLNSIKRKYKKTFSNLPESFGYTAEKRKLVARYIREKHGLGSFVWLRKKFSYLRDIWVDIKHNKGFVVTFSGVDGAGKTTIVSAVKQAFEQKYRKEVVLLRHRPGILPILSSLKYGGVKNAEAHAAAHLPRQGTNKSQLASLVRFAYYLTDYVFGQVYVYFKYILRGKVVIYDRYYFDFINDSKRSNITLNTGLIKRLFALIYKPEFNFYLYNDPEVILQRKQELRKPDIVLLNGKYAQLFAEFEMRHKGTYHQIKNDDRAKTVSEILETIHKVA